MPFVQGTKIGKSYDNGLTYIFREINFQIDEGKHIALVGANGSGKSTLMKIIAGVEDGEGSLQMKRGLTIGYQVQEPSFSEELSIKGVLEESFSMLKQMQRRIGELERAMAEAHGLELDAVLKEYGLLQEQFEALGGYTYEQQILKVATGLGFTELDLNRSAASLSGGEKSKLLLGKQLLARTDLLLLDEPTNHLDMESLEWLEGFLQNYSGTFIVVSHDRYFLDQVASEIWELERGSLTEYSGNYSIYLTEKEKRLKCQWVQYEKQQKEIKNLTQHANEQRINALKGEKLANSEDGEPNFYKRKAAKVMKRAKVAEAKREKLLTAERIEKPFEEREIRIKFPVEVETRGVILHVKDLAMAFRADQPLFQGLNFNLHAGSRVAVIGPNGAGKTTFLKIILGAMEPNTGEIVKSGRIRVGHYSQEQENLIEGKSALENILRSCSVDEIAVRTMLGSLKIEKEKVHIAVENLSGGEKSKVQLAKILLSGANLLILDEPTNHLDIDCREAVENALADYPGAILFVSHDRYFIHRLAQQLIYLNGVKSTVYLGDYRTFKERLEGNEVNHESADEMIKSLKLTALLGQLSLLREEQKEERERLEEEILSLKQGNVS